MCRSTTSIVYSPRRLVAIFASASDAPSEGRGSADGPDGSPDLKPDPPRMPDPRASWRNLNAPIPFGRKVRLVVRNMAIKVRTGSTCCGHPGEPGC